MLCALSVTTQYAGAREGVARLSTMTDPQMMQLDTVQALFRQLIAGAISLFAFSPSKYCGTVKRFAHTHTHSGGLHTFPVASEREDKPKSGCSPGRSSPAHVTVSGVPADSITGRLFCFGITMEVTGLVVRRLTLTMAPSANWMGSLELTSLTDALQHYRHTQVERRASRMQQVFRLDLTWPRRVVWSQYGLSWLPGATVYSRECCLLDHTEEKSPF